MKTTRSAGIRRFVAQMRQVGSRQRRRVAIAVIGAATVATTGAGAPPSAFGETGAEAEIVPAPLEVSFRAPSIPGARHSRIDFWVDRYSGNQREAFERQMHRRGRYEAMIQEKLAARGLPQDLIYLAWIESGFLDTVESHAGAVGLWQFMPATARGMGLRIDDVVDERRDPVRSTDAAVAFLQSLHRRYGSWHLALAAYNGGPTRVSRIVRLHGNGPWGHESQYWQLLEYLPQETGHYVPRLLAVRALAEAMEAEGFQSVSAEPYAYSLVWVDRAWTFAQIADATGITVNTLQDLNPHLIADRTPGGGTPYPLRVPLGTATRVASRLVRPERNYAMADD